MESQEKIFLFNMETQTNETKLNFHLIANSFKIDLLSHSL